MSALTNAQGTGDRRKTGWLLPVCGLLAVLSGLQTATQLFADMFGYQAALGSHLGHWYTPWSILLWADAWYASYPDYFAKAGGIGLLVTAIGLLCVAFLKVVQSNSAKAHAKLHGSARWANKKDIEAAGLLAVKKGFLARLGQALMAALWARLPTKAKAKAKTGKKQAAPVVYVGGWEDPSGQFHYLRHSGPEHVLCYAPTRSGKGVGLVVPTLLAWSQSCVITDLKGELWALTAGWRQQHAKNKVLRFEPASNWGSVRWNPLDEIRLGSAFEVSDVQNLATLIVDPDGKGLETHWQKTAFALLVGLILHALYLARDGKLEKANLAAVDAMLSDPKKPTKALWEEMAANETNAAIRSAGQDIKERPKEEGGSVLSTAKSYLSLYRDPVVAKNIADSDFCIKDLMHHDNPVSLYIVTQPNDKARLRPLIRILINMIVRLLADKMDFKDGRPLAHYKHRLLMMMDEFPSLGKLDIMQESLAFVAGYGIKCYLICQDLKQLKSRETGYGPDETITANCHVQNAYPTANLETAEHLSKLTGQTTVVKEQISTSGKRGALFQGQVSRSFQETQRPLLTPDEVMRMAGPKKNAAGEIEKPGDMVIYAAGFPAIYGKQPLYFQDPVFLARAKIAAPQQSDSIDKATRQAGHSPTQEGKPVRLHRQVLKP